MMHTEVASCYGFLKIPLLSPGVFLMLHCARVHKA